MGVAMRPDEISFNLPLSHVRHCIGWTEKWSHSKMKSPLSAVIFQEAVTLHGAEIGHF